MKTATVYKYGLHYGEESVVEGNDKAGMLYFSGCHLKCSFCYVPEMSENKNSFLPDNQALLTALQKLEEKGAKNLSLISVTHFWPSVLKTMNDYSTTLPWVIKLSGYEPFSFIEALSQKRNTVINFDFKVWEPSSAQKVGLPLNYGIKALDSLEYLQQNMEFLWNREQKLTQGVLVRHLWMPGFEDDSFKILLALKEEAFRGPINIMTHFVDNSTHQVRKAPSTFVARCKQIASDSFKFLLIDGEKV